MAWTEKRWNLLGWLAFSSLLFFNLYHHAMWVDELQAWSLTRASGDPYELFINLYPEGHPMLWYLLLWFPGRWTANPLGMQGVNFVLAVMSIGLIWLRSPLDWKEKLLLSLSYQVGYNFFVLSRCYSLGTLLVLVFVSFPSVFRQRSYLAWAVLGLLANVHLYFTAASLCLAIVWMGSQANSKRLLGGASAYLVGFFFAALALLRAMNPDETRFTHLPFVILLTFALGLGLWLFASDLAKATKVATWGTGAILVVSATILVVGNVASRGFKVNRLGRDLSVLGAGFLPLRNPFQPPLLGTRTATGYRCADLPHQCILSLRSLSKTAVGSDLPDLSIRPGSSCLSLQTRRTLFARRGNLHLFHRLPLALSQLRSKSWAQMAGADLSSSSGYRWNSGHSVFKIRSPFRLEGSRELAPRIFSECRDDLCLQTLSDPGRGYVS